MVKVLENKKTLLKLPILLALCFAFPGNVYAACTPGIPCTDYDINSDTTAGTDAGLNGPKTGLDAPYTGLTDPQNDGQCDGNFMNQMYAKAYLEASREVIINEQLIHKPDSVLEYTCFDQFIAMTAHFAGPIFSENDDFDNREVTLETADETDTTNYTVNFDDDHLDNALDELLLDSLEDYITNNFMDITNTGDHTFLGGESALQNTMDFTAIGGTTYSCNHMQAVWDVAKCRDFGEDDQFFNFETLSTEDPRILLSECSPGMTTSGGSNSPMTITENPKCPAAGGGPFANTNITNDIIRLWNNCEMLFVSFDPVTLYYELLKGPTETVGTTTYTCTDPLPTGLIVNVRRHTLIDNPPAGDIAPVSITDSTHVDKLCPNPGCWYDPGADSCNQ